MGKKHIREGGIVQFWNTWARGGQIDFQELGNYIMNPPQKGMISNKTMTLQEAISHCQEVVNNNNEHALEHKQLMMWLQELQCLRKVVDKKYLKGIEVLKDAYGDKFPHYFDIELRRDLTGMFAEK